MSRPINESAVSETIAVTLIVALTVIMAALVAAYVFGMVPTIPVSHSLAYTVDQPAPDKILIVFHGGPDAGSLSFARVTVTESGGGTPTYLNSTSDASEILCNKVGSVMTVTASAPNAFKDKDHVVITAHFINNKEQVMLDTFV